MSTGPTLKELQVWMSSLLTNPIGASSAISDSLENSFEKKWIHTITSDSVSSGQRLDIYAEAYFARILEAFTVDFPLTQLILGEDQFAKLIAEYLKIHPSQEYNLNSVSKNIIPFISNYSQSQVLVDITTLERLALESFYSPIDSSFDASSLSSLKEAEWELVKFELNSSIRFLESTWPLELLWKNRDSLLERNIQECHEKNYYLIDRMIHHISLTNISKTQFLILKKLSSGFPLSSISEEDLKDSSEDISLLFSSWVQKGLIKNFYL